jgi:uncharacterized protein (DUF1778 family)
MEALYYAKGGSKDSFNRSLQCTAQSRTIKIESEDAMMPREPTRTSRLEARVSPDVLAVLKRAAELEGRSVSDFVVAAAQDAAHRTIEEASIIRLSVEDQQRFAEALLNPEPLTSSMDRAVERYRSLVESGS